MLMNSCMFDTQIVRVRQLDVTAKRGMKIIGSVSRGRITAINNRGQRNADPI